MLRKETTDAMQHRETDCPGTPGFGHDGATIGQYGFLRVAPEAGVAVVLLTNGGGARRLYSDLFRELLRELAGIRMPAPFGPPARPLPVAPARPRRRLPARGRGDHWMPIVFSTLTDGTACAYIGMRAAPKIA